MRSNSTLYVCQWMYMYLVIWYNRSVANLPNKCSCFISQWARKRVIVRNGGRSSLHLNGQKSGLLVSSVVLSQEHCVYYACVNIDDLHEKMWCYSDHMKTAWNVDLLINIKISIIINLIIISFSRTSNSVMIVKQ